MLPRKGSETKQDQTIFVEEFETLKMLATDRIGCIRRELSTSYAIVKRMLHDAVNGAQLTQDVAAKPFIKRIQWLGRMLRWLSCSLLPDVYQEVSGKRWPEASTFAFLYQKCEDFILRPWVDFVLRSEAQHLSLHFDGVRVDRQLVYKTHSAIEDFNRDASAYIAQETGLVVKLTQKVHRSVQNLISEALCDVTITLLDADLQVLLSAGNCIPLALWRCGVPAINDRVKAVFFGESMENTGALKMRGRTYRSCCRFVNEGIRDRTKEIHLAPHLRFDPKHPGHYLLHSENTGNPHCCLVSVESDMHVCTVSNGEMVGKTTVEALREAVESGYDRKLVVTFAIGFGNMPPSPYPAIDEMTDLADLLDLLAGALEAGRTPAIGADNQ